MQQFLAIQAPLNLCLASFSDKSDWKNANITSIWVMFQLSTQFKWYQRIASDIIGYQFYELDFYHLHSQFVKKYVNIPSEKYIYVHIYVCICVYTYLCKMDERRSYASLSKKWMSAGLMPACHKNGWVPVLCWLVIKMDEYRYYAVLSKKWMSTGLMLACHKHGWVPALCWLVKKMMSTGIMLACHKHGWVPALCWLVKKMDEYRYLCWPVIKMDEYRYYAGLS